MESDEEDDEKPSTEPDLDVLAPFRQRIDSLDDRLVDGQRLAFKRF